MRKVLCTVLSTGFCLCLSAQDLDDVYNRLDDAIEHYEEIHKLKETTIGGLRASLKRSAEPSWQYSVCAELFEQYKSYENDSALAYAWRCLDLSEVNGERQLINESEIRVARQLAVAGAYVESRDNIAQVDKASLSSHTLIQYYEAQCYLYSEMNAYCSTGSRWKTIYRSKADAYFDSLCLVAPQNSRMVWEHKINKWLREGDYKNAGVSCDTWLSHLSDDATDYSMACYLRSEIYAKLGNIPMQKYWLARSSIADLRNAINDQASLWTLGYLLHTEGDHDRGFRYVTSAWHRILSFNAKLRKWQVAPIMELVNNENNRQIQKSNRHLQLLFFSVVLLSGVLVAMYLYVNKKRRMLHDSQKELHRINTELDSVNGQLTASNSELKEANNALKDLNVSLYDANRIKEEYIGEFLTICSRYIDKMDGYRIRINRKLKAHQYQELVGMTSSAKLKEDELRELTDRFDSIFLHLYPTFVEEFNALLRPEARMSLDDEGRMPTDMRIFALIRLGINNSASIADFLNYSPTSIYAYRGRVKNKALGSRNEFEEKVMRIGLGRIRGTTGF